MEHTQYFPEGFRFYHLGAIEPSSAPTQARSLDQSFVVLFRVTGDEQGYCAVVYEQRPPSTDEESVSIELANVLASKFVSQFADATGDEVFLSAPELFQPSERRHRHVARFLENAATARSGRRYEFQKSTNETKTVLHLIYLPDRVGQA